jgi:hypothetical protein
MVQDPHAFWERQQHHGQHNNQCPSTHHSLHCTVFLLAGPSYTVPFLGSIVEMVQDPHAFWERQRDYSTPGLSWNSIVTKFTVMVTDPATIRHCFNHNRCGTAGLAGTCYCVLAAVDVRERDRPGHSQQSQHTPGASRQAGNSSLPCIGQLHVVAWQIF